VGDGSQMIEAPFPFSRLRRERYWFQLFKERVVKLIVLAAFYLPKIPLQTVNSLPRIRNSGQVFFNLYVFH
jgi:hypothetical protein